MNSNMNAVGAFLPNEFSFSASALGESAPSAPSATSMKSPPAELSDAELLAATRRLVGRSNRLLATLLAHLGEVEARGIHRTRAYSSLYAYCIYELRFSEDEAFRRVSAARLVRRFPLLLDTIAAGELHLTGLLMLGPHLTTENLLEVLARAKHRTKKEIAGLVRMLDPLPDVPPRIEPLGPAPATPALLASSAPTWSQFVGSMNLTRDLAPGHRPVDWTEDAEGTTNGEDSTPNVAVGRLDVTDCGSVAANGGEWVPVNGSELEQLDATDHSQLPSAAFPLSDDTALARGAAFPLSDDNALARGTAFPRPDDNARATLARGTAFPRPDDNARARGTAFTALARPASVTPQRYKVQFTASEEHVKLVAEAKALLSHSAQCATLDEIHLRAMRALVAELQRRKYAVTKRPPVACAPATETSNARQRLGKRRAGSDSESKSKSEPAIESDLTQKGEVALEPVPEPTPGAGRLHQGGRGRYVSAATRRAVFAREQGRCTYATDSGQRCRETNRLELHHTRAFARGGEHTEQNITLRCRAHNGLAAEQDFGRESIELARDSTKHEPWTRNVTARGD